MHASSLMVSLGTPSPHMVFHAHNGTAGAPAGVAASTSGVERQQESTWMVYLQVCGAAQGWWETPGCEHRSTPLHSQPTRSGRRTSARKHPRASAMPQQQMCTTNPDIK